MLCELAIQMAELIKQPVKILCWLTCWLILILILCWLMFSITYFPVCYSASAVGSSVLFFLTVPTMVMVGTSSSSEAADWVHKRWRNCHTWHCAPSVHMSHQAKPASPGSSPELRWSASLCRLASSKRSWIVHHRPHISWCHSLLACWAYTAGKDSDLLTREIIISK